MPREGNAYVRRRRSVGREWFQTIAVTWIVFLFMETFVLQGFRVYGSCMEPNLVTGERLLGNKFVYRMQPLRRGDVIVFRFPQDPTKIYVKRVIGMPGESVEIREGAVLINGRPMRERYVVNLAHGDYPATDVPAGRYFVLGDNRDHSSDSRAWGTVPAGLVEGKVWVRYWPLGRVHVF